MSWEALKLVESISDVIWSVTLIVTLAYIPKVYRFFVEKGYRDREYSAAKREIFASASKKGERSK